ncbi:hypothetical protein EVAR_78343_1 [Eumeta japonica]|uniref:Uncharacterized protein n=1 Tax=Eumeta variegata TaxID=151549 RepID=A0A4C1T458_EUMVA|nr:hypothetical protein EVAR_78343_1 [Eumeta japonica]
MLKKIDSKLRFLNAGSFGTNHDEFIIAVQKHNVDIITINENRHRERAEGRAPFVPNYPTPHVVRARGIGVGFYVEKATLRPPLIFPSGTNVD